jgi:hypothetical protein
MVNNKCRGLRKTSDTEKSDPIEWLLKHPAEIKSKDLNDRIKKIRNSHGLIKSMKEELWTGD